MRTTATFCVQPCGARQLSEGKLCGRYSIVPAVYEGRTIWPVMPARCAVRYSKQRASITHKQVIIQLIRASGLRRHLAGWSPVVACGARRRRRGLCLVWHNCSASTGRHHKGLTDGRRVRHSAIPE